MIQPLLLVGLVGWVRPFIDQPSSVQLEEIGQSIKREETAPLLIVGISLILLLLSVGGLIGMFFNQAIFRWLFLTGVLGMIFATWFLPVAKTKPRRDRFFGDFFRLVDGAILALVFFG